MPSYLPMKATTARLPRGGDWTYELKWDGMRAILEVVDGELQIWSSNAKDATPSYPELHPLGAAFAHIDVVLDGEIVALDDQGRPNFGRLQHRMHITRPADAARRAAEVPVELVLFDVLQVGDRPTVALPLRDRRRLLASLADDLPAGVQVAPVFTDGDDLLATAERQGLEGVMAKRAGSTYLPGRRSGDWVKVKVQRRQELVVGGWADGQGERAGTLGALLVGYYDATAPGRPFRYAGRVGTGYTAATLSFLRERLAPLAVDGCPFDPPPPPLRARDAHWVHPALVVEVSYGNWTEEGLLRHPVYLGLRSDKDPHDVVREPSPAGDAHEVGAP
ncbi:MAG TPA: non-homologous end-joining DNA ligase [Acidimicrobiales bacterium]